MNQTCYGLRGARGVPDFFTYWNVRMTGMNCKQRTHGYDIRYDHTPDIQTGQLHSSPVELVGEFEKRFYQ